MKITILCIIIFAAFFSTMVTSTSMINYCFRCSKNNTDLGCDSDLGALKCVENITLNVCHSINNPCNGLTSYLNITSISRSEVQFTEYNSIKDCKVMVDDAYTYSQSCDECNEADAIVRCNINGSSQLFSSISLISFISLLVILLSF